MKGPHALYGIMRMFHGLEDVKIISQSVVIKKSAYACDVNFQNDYRAAFKRSHTYVRPTLHTRVQEREG